MGDDVWVDDGGSGLWLSRLPTEEDALVHFAEQATLTHHELADLLDCSIGVAMSVLISLEMRGRLVFERDNERWRLPRTFAGLSEVLAFLAD